MKNESIIKRAKSDTMRIKIRSVTVGSAVLAVLLSMFQQAAAQNSPLGNMLSDFYNMNQLTYDMMNNQNNYLSGMERQLGLSSQAVPAYYSTRPAAPLRQYPITATDFRPEFQCMAPDLLAIFQPGLTHEQREGLSNLYLMRFEIQGRKNNVASAMTYLFRESVMVTTGQQLTERESDQMMMRFNNALATNVEFKTKSPRDKQQLYEWAIVVGGLIHAYAQGNFALQSEGRKTARFILTSLGFQVR